MMIDKKMLQLLFYSVLMATLKPVLTESPDSLLRKFNQHDYTIIKERLELVHYNKHLVKYASATTFKYNRTTPLANGTFILNVDMENKVEVVVQAYKFLSNEYREFPLRFQINLCQALSNNVIGSASLKRCGNFTGCPLKKGVLFHICNWTVDEAMFPPFIPNGQYMVELQGFYLGTETALVRIYGRVTRPIV